MTKAEQVERLVAVDELHLDYETYCDLNLKSVGLDVYSSHPSCEVLMVAYRINGGKLQQWIPKRNYDVPNDLRRALLSRKTLKWAFNAQFERIITRRVLKIKTPIRGWRCTQVLAYMHCFAGGLAQVGSQTGISVGKQKSATGKDLIKIFCGPNKETTNQPHIRRNWKTDPELWKEFCAYNRQDVRAEEAILRRLRPYPIPDFEWKLYELDQRINDRGIPIDMKFVNSIIKMAADRKRELADEMREITGLDNPNSQSQLLPWLKDHGYTADDIRAETVKKFLKTEIADNDLRAVLLLRQNASLTSVNKAATAKRFVGRGNCIRFMLQFGGASRTLRWAGRAVQTQNMKRTPKQFEEEKRLTRITNLIRYGRYLELKAEVSEIMIALSGCMRSMFRCPKGEEFVTADLKSIESAVIAWVTKCKRLLAVFAEGRDPYKDFGREFYQKPEIEITSEERGICKPPALGCGFRMGAGQELPDGKKTGLLGYAENMGVDLSPEQTKKAVEVFRTIYEEIPNHWKLYEIAIRRVMDGQNKQQVGDVTFERVAPYLLIRLPSGRCIYYFQPKIESKTVIVEGETMMVLDNATGEKVEVIKSYVRKVFTHWGRDNTTTGRNVWRRIESHGGVIIENLVQAIARDVLAIGMMRAHKAGFHIVGHAHDEIIARHPVGERTCQQLCSVMSEAIEWAQGLPLGAAGWQAPFYRKA